MPRHSPDTAVIAVVNQKGGAGKTTLAMQLAGALARRGPTLVLDADPQGTASRWAACARGKPFPARVEAATGDALARRLGELGNAFRFVVVDGSPTADGATLVALGAADLALVPVNPSPLDLWASLGTRVAYERALTRNPALTARLVVNQAQPKSALTRDVRALLADFGIPPLANGLRQRAVYRQCAAYGQTVYAYRPRSPDAVSEVEALACEALALLAPADSKKTAL